MFFIFLSLTIVISCTKNENYCEYKIVYFTGDNSRDGVEAFKYQTITHSEDDLNKLGAEGWEIATSYLEMETAFPNFGKDEYHTGIKENVRPQRLVMIFKREKGVYPESKN